MTSILASDWLMYDNYRLNVEEKKMRGAGDRERPGPGSFNMDRGDMNKRGSQVRSHVDAVKIKF